MEHYVLCNGRQRFRRLGPYSVLALVPQQPPFERKIYDTRRFPGDQPCDNACSTVEHTQRIYDHVHYTDDTWEGDPEGIVGPHPLDCRTLLSLLPVALAGRSRRRGS